MTLHLDNLGLTLHRLLRASGNIVQSIMRNSRLGIVRWSDEFVVSEVQFYILLFPFALLQPTGFFCLVRVSLYLGVYFAFQLRALAVVAFDVRRGDVPITVLALDLIAYGRAHDDRIDVVRGGRCTRFMENRIEHECGDTSDNLVYCTPRR